MDNSNFTEFKSHVSWGSIFAGVITVIAISILLSILGSSIGLYMFNPLSSNPASGVGTTMGIWSVISLLISLAAGGFVAGKLSGSDGIIHGFIVWAMTLFISIFMIVCLAVSTAKLTFNVLGSVSSAVGNLASGVGSVVDDGLSGLSDQAKSIFSDINISTDNDKSNVQNDVRQALKKSGIKELQPEYLNNQMNDIKSDLNSSLEKIMKNPSDADNIVSEFVKNLESRAKKMSAKIDRNDLTNAIANNSNMSKAEVDKTVNEYIELRNDAIEKGQEQIEKLSMSIEQAKQKLDEMKHEALVKAEKASNTAATSGLISFFALAIGAVVCSMVGRYGAEKTKQGYDA